MEPLRQSIQTLFLRQNPVYLLKRFLKNNNKYPAEGPTRQDFILLYREDFPAFTLDQIETVFNVLTSQWLKEDKKACGLFYFPGASVFNTLLHYANFTLREENFHPICLFPRLLGWHDLTQKVSEDLITTAYLAAIDSFRNTTRPHFEWPCVIEHDNATLNDMLNNKDVAELHAHLKGSSHTFELNWIELMNHIDGREKEFESYKKYQKSEISINPEEIGSLYNNIIVAAAIRLYLFERTNNNTCNGTLWNTISTIFNSASNGDETSIPVLELEDIIDSYRNIYGKRYQIIDEDVIIDYAIPKDIAATPLSTISGDRKLIYDVFKKLIKEGDKELQMLLYLYLVIKLKYRSEMIQTNKFVGFANFANYEGRKSVFLDKTKKTIIPALATRSFFEKNKDHRYFEARLVPNENHFSLFQDIEDTEYSIQHLLNGNIRSFLNPIEAIEERNYQCFYIMHFIKEQEKPTYEQIMECRHNKARERYKRQAESIFGFRQHSLNRSLIVGIDAANSEIFCRPEVFAQEFRYLRKQYIEPSILDTLNIKRPQQLCITYHVGEDFMDIADGLRAVDEAIHFIGLKNGDRIGHGLVLGTDVDKYYHDRSMMLTIKRHDWLDNVAWMHHECCGSNCNLAIIQQLKKWYSDAYREIYPNGITNSEIADIDSFYLSWALRGDSPQPYFENKVPTSEYPIEQRDGEKFNCDNLAIQARESKVARDLYKAYHFNRDVRQKGDESISIKVTEEYIEAVKIIQQKMLNKIQYLHIAIECNPTSNYRIGEFTRYAAHPLLKFFNYGLITDYPPHSISISINTDDSGVFATSIEREYALIALALLKDNEFVRQNQPRAIYDWLNRIRELSQEQRFVK